MLIVNIEWRQVKGGYKTIWEISILMILMKNRV